MPGSKDMQPSRIASGTPDATPPSTPPPAAEFADFEAERAVLACILAEPDSLNTAISALGGFQLVQTKAGKGGRARGASSVPENAENYFRRVATTMFRDPRNAAIYESVLELQAKGSKIDLLSVSDHLQRNGRLDMIGGQERLLDVMNSIGSIANLETWCGILKDWAMLRETVRACTTAVQLCKEPGADARTLLDEIENTLYQVRAGFVSEENKSFRQLLSDVFEYFNNVLNRKIETGILTGFPDLDRLTGGLKPGEMFVLAARPSIGKTALALNIVRNIALKEAVGAANPRKKIAFFSLEMSAEAVTQRLLCTQSRIPLTSILDGSFNKADIGRLTTAVNILRDAQIFIDPTGGLTIYELRAKARKLMDSEKIDLIVIDYLQLMRAPEVGRESRQVEVAAISGGLKKLAKDLNVPVLVLAQLNRETEKGAPAGKNVKPKLTNLRESGSIEQDADVVVFLHRERDDSKESNREANRSGVKSSLIVEKNRNGKTGELDLLFFPSLMEFRSVDHKIDAEDVPIQAKI